MDFSFSYDCDANTCELDSFSFEGSLFSDFITYDQINTDSNKAAVGVLRFDIPQMPPTDEGPLASLWFTVSSYGQPQHIAVDTCRLLSRHVTVLCRDGYEPVKPTVIGLGAFTEYVCGDADYSGDVNILDATCLINYLYKEGPAPFPEVAGDADGSGVINLLDATYIINYPSKTARNRSADSRAVLY